MFKTIKTSVWQCSVVAIFATVSISTAWSDADLQSQYYDAALAQEQELLMRSISKLDESLALARAARRVHSENSTYWFDYEKYYRDLRLVREGILHFIYADSVNLQDGSTVEPNPFQGLAGDYLVPDDTGR